MLKCQFDTPRDIRIWGIFDSEGYIHITFASTRQHQAFAPDFFRHHPNNEASEFRDKDANRYIHLHFSSIWTVP